MSLQKYIYEDHYEIEKHIIEFKYALVMFDETFSVSVNDKRKLKLVVDHLNLMNKEIIKLGKYKLYGYSDDISYIELDVNDYKYSEEYIKILHNNIKSMIRYGRCGCDEKTAIDIILQPIKDTTEFIFKVIKEE